MGRLLLLSCLVACSTADDPEYTKGVGDPGTPHRGADGRIMRVGADAAPDANVPDAADVRADAAPDPTDAAALPPDMAAVVADAAPDVAPPPECAVDDDCTLAVVLDACDPCPVPRSRAAVVAAECTIVYDREAFSAHEPASCRAACPAGTPEFCEGRVFPVRCQAGACVPAP